MAIQKQLEMAGGIERGAFLSPDRKYRYTLTREFPEGFGALVWIMLNPSTADAEIDDPTIRVLMHRTKEHGFKTMRVVNLFALRTPKPAVLKKLGAQGEDIVGPCNDEMILSAIADAYIVIAAWGPNGSFQGRDAAVKKLIPGQFELHCLGTTKDGHPRHPLYVRYAEKIRAWQS